MPKRRSSAPKVDTPETSITLSEPAVKHAKQPAISTQSIMVYVCVALMVLSIAFFVWRLYKVKFQKKESDDGKISQQEFFDILARQVRSLGPEEKLDDKPTMLMITKPDCPACAVMYPEVASFSRVLPFLSNKPINVLRVVASEHPKIIEETGVNAVPTMCFYKDGKYVKTVDDIGIERWVHFLKEEIPHYFEASTTPTNVGENSPIDSSDIKELEEPTLDEQATESGDGDAARESARESASESSQ